MSIITGAAALAVGGAIWWAFRGSQEDGGDGEIGDVAVTQTSVPIAGPNYFLATGRKSSPPKSVRNNNPTNMRYLRTSAFDGQTGNDGGYGVYRDVLSGTRAGFKNLQNYFSRDGLDTVREIVSKWAPSSENPTSSYITFVAGQLGVSPDQGLRYDVHARSLIKAMSRFEAGYQPYTDQLYADAYKAAA